MHAWTAAIAHADAWNLVLEDAGIDLDELYEKSTSIPPPTIPASMHSSPTPPSTPSRKRQ